jgi:hypothetical protein
LTSVENLERFIGQFKLTQVPRSDCLILDTDESSPEVTASAIIRHFGLQ